MKKRILAFVMAVILCVGLLPVGVMAEEFNGEEVDVEAASVGGLAQEGDELYPEDPDEEEEPEEPEEPEDLGAGPAFNPYIFDQGGDTVSVQLQPELMDPAAEEEEEMAAPAEDDADAELPPAEPEETLPEEPAPDEEIGAEEEETPAEEASDEADAAEDCEALEDEEEVHSAESVSPYAEAPVLLSAELNANMTAVTVQFTTAVVNADCYSVDLLSMDWKGAVIIDGLHYQRKSDPITIPYENANVTRSADGSIDTVLLTAPVLAELQDGETVYVSVMTEKESVFSDRSNLKEINVGGPTEAQLKALTPKNFAAEPASSNSTVFFVNLSWDAQSGVGSYMIEDVLINGTIGLNHYEGSPKQLINATSEPGNPFIGQYSTQDGRSFFKNYGIPVLQAGEEQLYEPGNGHTYARGVQSGDRVTVVMRAEVRVGNRGYMTPAANATAVYQVVSVPETSIDSGTVIQSAKHDLQTNTTTVVFKTNDTASQYYELYGLTEDNLGDRSMGQFNITGTLYQTRAIDSLSRDQSGTVSVSGDGKTVTITDRNVYFGENTPFQKGDVVYFAVQTEKGMDNNSISRPYKVVIGDEDPTEVVTMTAENTQIRLENETLTYTGREIRPAVEAVICNGRELKPDQDYSIRYENNIRAGSGAKVIAEGKGRYKGSVEQPFAIGQVSMGSENANITSVLPQSAYRYTGEEVMPKPDVRWNGNPLTQGQDYSLSYKNNIKITTSEMPAYVIIDGIGNFNGTRMLPFDIQQFNLLQFDTLGGSMIPDQEVAPGEKPAKPADPSKSGSIFFAWYKDKDYTQGFDFNETLTNATTVFARYVPETVSLDRDYVLLELRSGDSNTTKPLDSVNLSTNLPADLQEMMDWSTEKKDTVVKVVNGKVTAVSPGTDFVVATLPVGSAGLSVAARCRVDVYDKSFAEQDANMTAVLPVTKVTSEIYRTDYTQVEVILKLQQNLEKVLPTDNSEANDDDPWEVYSHGVAIMSAEFEEDSEIGKAFRPYPVDDRTLELRPLIDFNEPGYEKAVKDLKGSYKGKINLYLSNGLTVTTPELTVTVKKSLPKLKAETVKVNGFIAGQTVPVVITGGSIVTPVEEKLFAAKGVSFAKLNADLTVTVLDGVTKGGSAAVELKNCELADWAVPANVKITVNNSYKAPKVTVKPGSLTLNAGVTDRAFAAVTVTPLDGMRHQITVGNDAGLATEYDPATGLISVARGRAAVQNKQYSVTVFADGKPVAALKVKVAQVPSAKIKLTVKAAGAIDTGIAGSPVTLTVTGQNYNAAAGGYDVILVRQQGTKGAEEGVTDLFTVTKNANVITFCEKNKGSLNGFIKGWTYSAKVIPGNADLPTPNAVKFSVKQSAKTQESITLKATGSIDVLRPGTRAVITPTVKNIYGYVLTKDMLTYDKNLFDCELVDGTFVITAKDAKDGAVINPKVAQTVSLKIGNTSSKAVKLPLKMGSATINQSVKTVTLSKVDRFDRQTVKLSLTDNTLYDISLADVSFAGTSAGLEVKPLGNSEFAVGYANNTLPGSFKNGTAKLNVTLLGNGTGKANKTISVSVKFA